MIWRRRISNLGVIVVIGLTGALLVSLALPRTVGGIAMLHGNRVYDAMQAGREVTVHDLERLIESRERALVSLNDATIWSELALATLTLARTLEDNETEHRSALLQTSIEAGRQSLRLNPANGYGWLRLAQARLIETGPDDATVRALTMTLRTAPHDRQIVFPEVELCLLLWSRLDEESRRLAQAQIRYAQVRYVGHLAELAKRYLAAPIVRQALSSEPDHLRRFNEHYARL